MVISCGHACVIRFVLASGRWSSSVLIADAPGYYFKLELYFFFEGVFFFFLIFVYIYISAVWVVWGSLWGSWLLHVFVDLSSFIRQKPCVRGVPNSPPLFTILFSLSPAITLHSLSLFCFGPPRPHHHHGHSVCPRPCLRVHFVSPMCVLLKKRHQSLFHSTFRPVLFFYHVSR